jgi:four helix bundle protein
MRGIDRHLRDQLIRAAQSIVLNIAEGNGKQPSPDRRRFLQIAYGSALECAGALDILVVCGVLKEEQIMPAKHLLARIVAMLVKMVARLEYVCEEEPGYGMAESFPDELA